MIGQMSLKSELDCSTTKTTLTFQGFFEGIRATRGGAGGPGAPRPAVGAGALAMDTMDDDAAAGGVSLNIPLHHGKTKKQWKIAQIRQCWWEPPQPFLRFIEHIFMTHVMLQCVPLLWVTVMWFLGPFLGGLKYVGSYVIRWFRYP